MDSVFRSAALQDLDDDDDDGDDSADGGASLEPITTGDIVMRTTSLATAIRLWQKQVLANECGDVAFSKGYLEDMTAWLNRYSYQLRAPQLSHNVDSSRGRHGFAYKAIALIRSIVLCGFVTDNSKLSSIARQVGARYERVRQSFGQRS